VISQINIKNVRYKKEQQKEQRNDSRASLIFPSCTRSSIIHHFSAGQRPANPCISSTGINYRQQLHLNFLSRGIETSSHTFRTSIWHMF